VAGTTGLEPVASAKRSASHTRHRILWVSCAIGCKQVDANHHGEHAGNGKKESYLNQVKQGDAFVIRRGQPGADSVFNSEVILLRLALDRNHWRLLGPPRETTACMKVEQETEQTLQGRMLLSQ